AASTLVGEAASMQDHTTPNEIARARAQVAELKQMFRATGTARAGGRRAKPLFERLGGRDAIHAVVTDIVELHYTDPVTASLCVGVDKQKMIAHVVDWLCQAAGGPAAYKGRDMVAAHAHLH